MSTLQIVLMIAVPLLIAGLTTWINMRIKFAPDAAQAMRDAKSDVSKVLSFLFRLLGYLVCFVMVMWIIWAIFLGPWPLDRWSFFFIVSYLFMLSFLVMMVFVNKLLDFILIHSKALAVLAEATHIVIEKKLGE